MSKTKNKVQVFELGIKNFAVQGFLWAMSANCSFVAVMILNRMFQMHVSVILVIWGRCFFALALILPFLQWKDMTRLWAVQLMRGAMITGAMLCSYTAYRHLPVHFAALIGASSSLFTMILARIFLQEIIDKKRWIAVCIGYMGVMILVHDALSTSWNVCIVWAVLGNLLAAIGSILSRWLILNAITPQSSMIYGMIVPCILFSLIIIIDPNISISTLSLKQWKILALLGGIGAWIQYATFQAYKVTKASFVAPLEYTRLCLMIPAGYIFLGEVPTLWSFLGGSLIALISVCFFVWEIKNI